jgi:hypothetical protein
LFGGILDSGILVATFAGFEFIVLLCLARFAGKNLGNISGQFDHPTSIHRHGTGLASGRIYPHYLTLLPPPPLRKMKFKLNRWITNSQTHTNQYFSGLP